MLNKTATKPERRTSAALAAIPRRTPVWVHVNADPLAETTLSNGKKHGTRVEYTNRAQRRAFAKANRVRVPAPALTSYAKAGAR